MAFHWALSWKCSQPCIFPFYFFHLLFSKKHVCMFGCHWFCHVLCIFWAGWVVVSAAFFVSRVPSMSNTPRITSNLGVISRNGIPLDSFLEVFPALHVSFLFLQSSFSKKHVCMFGCHWFWHVLCIFWAGWVVVSAAFFVSRGSEHVEYPENNFKLGGNLTEWHSTGLSPGSVPSLAFFLSISSTFFSARSMCVCLVVTGFVMFCAFSGLVGWLCQMAFHWALSWKRSQPCILLFYFFHLLFSKKHVFMFCRLWSVGLCAANGQST